MSVDVRVCGCEGVGVGVIVDILESDHRKILPSMPQVFYFCLAGRVKFMSVQVKKFKN